MDGLAFQPHIIQSVLLLSSCIQTYKGPGHQVILPTVVALLSVILKGADTGHCHVQSPPAPPPPMTELIQSQDDNYLLPAYPKGT